ncbi:hypothetical protein E3U43_022815 [Larimichthys crocea]|uniref:Uncharacterized protein n=1 Tax=Larimichthys crocea TaxID=215358 RepID=A0ACD3R4L3_LARCR|nr:hypothetical protein E3U43_022815 [Larimichthys crocea]
MCREEEEEVEAPETGKYVLVKYCLTHDWRSGEHGKVREGKKKQQGLSWLPRILHLHIQQQTVRSFFLNWLCKKQKQQHLLLQMSSVRKSGGNPPLSSIEK